MPSGFAELSHGAPGLIGRRRGSDRCDRTSVELVHGVDRPGNLTVVAA